jgi:hypothetical protein
MRLGDVCKKSLLNVEFIDIKIIKIGHELTSRYIFETLLFYMKYIGNIGSVGILISSKIYLNTTINSISFCFC